MPRWKAVGGPESSGPPSRVATTRTGIFRSASDHRPVLHRSKANSDHVVVVNEKIAKGMTKQMKWTGAATAIGAVVAFLAAIQLVSGVNSLVRWMKQKMAKAKVERPWERSRIHAREWKGM